MMLEDFGLDRKRLEQRINFLRWRAVEHQRPREHMPFEQRRHWAAAATCFRDAAVLALALGDQENAQALLYDAAQLDKFHWESFLVPFDLVDLDIAFLGALDTNNKLLDAVKHLDIFNELTLLSIERGKLPFPTAAFLIRPSRRPV